MTKKGAVLNERLYHCRYNNLQLYGSTYKQG